MLPLHLLTFLINLTKKCIILLEIFWITFKSDSNIMKLGLGLFSIAQSFQYMFH